MSDDPLAGYSASLEAKTGKNLVAWAALAKAHGETRHAALVA